MAATSISISTPPGGTIDPSAPRPAHHLNDTKTSFQNPWPSFQKHGFQMMAKMIWNSTSQPEVPEDVESLVKLQKPNWGVDPSLGKRADPTKIKATWLGHACFLVELPAPEGAARGPRILFDPVFSHRCSPFSWLGPGRYTKTPCTTEEIPSVDVIVISHNHYDHMDTATLTTLEKLHKPHIFAPLGNGYYFEGLKIPTERTHILDWWEARHVAVELPPASPASEPVNAEFAVHCTPAQHFTARGLHDRFKTLWASWAVEDLSGLRGVKVWFGGDTGYRTVLDGQDEDKVPVCPEFKKIGEKFGGFELALIPIGAYIPRDFMSAIHCAPQDSVRVFKDIRAKRAIGMHWGTWILTQEPVLEPPRRLAEECTKIGIEKGAFDVCGLGETVSV